MAGGIKGLDSGTGDDERDVDLGLSMTDGLLSRVSGGAQRKVTDSEDRELFLALKTCLSADRLYKAELRFLLRMYVSCKSHQLAFWVRGVISFAGVCHSFGYSSCSSSYRGGLGWLMIFYLDDVWRNILLGWNLS